MQKITKTFIIYLCLFSLSFSTALAADPYFGFKLGKQNFVETRKDLKERGSAFGDTLNYKGYDELPTIQITQHAKFALEGKLRYSTLDFDPNGDLYQVTISWDDDRTLFNRWKEILDNYNYTIVQNCSTKGFEVECSWRDQLVTFTLNFTPSGFGNNSRTNLNLIYAPSVPLVEAEKERIDKLIAKEQLIRDVNRFK